MEYSIDYGEIRALEQQYRQAPRIVQEELTAAVTEADLLIYRELSERVPVGAGGAAGLKGSLFHEERVDGTNAVGLVATAISYAVPVELGTRPHFPPVDALVDWVKAKLGVTTEREARSVAFLIARKIAARGTKAQLPFEQTFQAVQSQVVSIFDNAAARIAQRLQEGG